MLGRLLFLALFAITAVTVSGCQTTTPVVSAYSVEPVATVPYRMDYMGWITIEAKVNGEGPYDFILDTGATVTAIFNNLTIHQEFPPSARGTIRTLGLAGVRELPAVTIGGLDIDALSFRAHTGVLLPDWRNRNAIPQGVIGLDILSQYNILIDTKHQQIQFFERGAPLTAQMQGWTRAPLKTKRITEVSRPLYETKVRIRGEDIPCVIDLGASGSVFNYPAYRRMTHGISVGGRRRGENTGTRIRDVFDTIEKAFYVVIPSVRIGNAEVTSYTAVIFDAPIFRELGAHKRAFCLLGVDLFANHSVLFDFDHETLFIQRYPNQ